MSILQKIRFELNYASQFTKGYCFPARGNKRIETVFNHGTIAPFFWEQTYAPETMSIRYSDIRTSLRITVNNKVMDFFKLMTSWY